MANTLETVRDSLGKITAHTAGYVTWSEAKIVANTAYQKILNANEWSWTVQGGHAIQTVAEYTTGTVTVTKDSKTVTGSGTTFTAALVGRFFGGPNDSYIEIAAFVSTTEVTLKHDYVGATKSGASYSVWKNRFSLPDDVRQVLSLSAPSWSLEERTWANVDTVDQDRSTTGEPVYYYYTGRDSSGNVEIGLWPIPVTQLHLPLIGMAEKHELSLSDVLGEVSPVLLDLARWEVMLLASVKAAVQKDNQLASQFRAVANDYGQSYSMSLEQLAFKDLGRWGRDERAPRSVSHGLAGRTNLDLGY